MALDKAIKSGKEYRKMYIGKDYCKSVDKHCRNHGGRRHSWQCQWCLDNRTYKQKAMVKNAKKELQDFQNQ